jgi:RNA polymerase sigma factor (sigma-70 family)
MKITGEEIMSRCSGYVWKRWGFVNYADREEIIAQMVLGMTEAAAKIDESKTEEEANGYLWQYAKGYAKKWFSLRNRIAKKETVALDWDKGTDGKSDDAESLTMHEIIANNDKPEGLSLEMTEALDSLSPREREIVRLRHVEGLTVDEAAERMQVNRITLYKREEVALEKLRFRLMVKAA